MATDSYNDMVDLVDGTRLVKNEVQKLLKEELPKFMNDQRSELLKIAEELKPIVKEYKKEKHKIFARDISMLALGIALATFGCFNFSGWLNYDQITTSSNLKIQQEQIAKEKLALAAVKNKYEKFDKFYELVSLLAEFNSKDEKAVTILHDTNYLEKTLKLTLSSKF